MSRGDSSATRARHLTVAMTQCRLGLHRYMVFPNAVSTIGSDVKSILFKYLVSDELLLTQNRKIPDDQILRSAPRHHHHENPWPLKFFIFYQLDATQRDFFTCFFLFFLVFGGRIRSYTVAVIYRLTSHLASIRRFQVSYYTPLLLLLHLFCYMYDVQDCYSEWVAGEWRRCCSQGRMVANSSFCRSFQIILLLFG